MRAIIAAACCVATVWIVETAWASPAKGLQNSFLGTLVSVAALLLVFRVTAKDITTFLFFAFLYLAFAFLCLLTSSLALILTFSLLGKNQKYRNFQKYLIVAVSIALAFLQTNNTDWIQHFPNLTVFVLVKLLGVFLFDVLIITASSRISDLAIQNSENFRAIRQWAIAVSTWGSTSFHNLDLSGVNFSGSRLANADLRARKLYRTCFQGVTGLDRARVDDRYLDLNNLNVQRLLTQRDSQDKNFNRVNLRGAYLQDADMGGFQLVEANLDEADLRRANLSHSLLARASVRDADLTEAKLTGICIEDWNFNGQTIFTDVQCDYVYRALTPEGVLADRYPADRNFAPGEFAALCQRISNAAEVVFSGQLNRAALDSVFEKLRFEENDLGLELIGIVPQNDTWMIKVAHKPGVSSQQVQQQIIEKYEEEIHWLRNHADRLSEQLARNSENASRPSISNNFNIIGSQVDSLVGSGEIYNAAQRIPSIIAAGRTSSQIISELQKLFEQLSSRPSEITLERQTELLRQGILQAAQTNSEFREFIVRQGQQITQQMPSGAIATAIQSAIAQLS